LNVDDIQRYFTMSSGHSSMPSSSSATAATSGTASTTAVAPDVPEPTTTSTTAANSNEGGAGGGEATLLVSEFPPPPYYYRCASSLAPPPIPHDALERGTRRAATVAALARAEAERLRGMAVDTGDSDNHALLSGTPAVGPEEEGNVVAVFGEIVEDPLLCEPLDVCEDPKVVRDELKRLNRLVLQKFVNLVQDLVHRPSENK
jgi:hypothetical protein